MRTTLGAMAALAYSVGATKKGGVPVRVESRKSGKKVVLIENAEGDVKALLKDLQAALGTGGVLRGGCVEVQGEHHLARVTKFLLESGCIVGACKQVKVAGGVAVAAAQERRVDPSDGNAYPLSSFIEVYGGSRDDPPPQWRAAVPRPQRGGAVAAAAVGAAAGGASAKPILPINRQTAKTMKPPELKAALVARGASVQGNKKDLLERLLSLL